MLQNLVRASLTEEDKDKILGLIKEIKELLPPLLGLSLKEKQKLAIMGDKTLAFVGKTIEFARQTPEILPAYLDMTEVEKDYAMAERLAAILYALDGIRDGVHDTHLAASSDAFTNSLIYYNVVKTANKAGFTGMDTIYKELQKRFPSRRKQDTAELNSDEKPNDS